MEDYKKLQLNGKRTAEELTKTWNQIHELNETGTNKILIKDNMQGYLSVFELWELTEKTVGNKFIKQPNIAVILEEQTSYNQKVFERIAKDFEINLKHFTKEQKAKEWLIKQI